METVILTHSGNELQQRLLTFEWEKVKLTAGILMTISDTGLSILYFLKNGGRAALSLGTEGEVRSSRFLTEQQFAHWVILFRDISRDNENISLILKNKKYYFSYTEQGHIIGEMI